MALELKGSHTSKEKCQRRKRGMLVLKGTAKTEALMTMILLFLGHVSFIKQSEFSFTCMFMFMSLVIS